MTYDFPETKSKAKMLFVKMKESF